MVEDVSTNQVVAKTMLAKLGLSVDIAQDGLEAITKWQGNRYDLIFMDCRMPNMDGYQATKHIRSNESHVRTPIIALTANVTEEDRLKCKEAGMDAVIMKPFKPTDLQNALVEWLDSEVKPKKFSEASIDEIELSTKSRDAIDLNTFRNTQQLLGDGFSELVDSIVTDLASILERLSSWSDLLDIDGLALLPHSMKSASAYIGAMKLNQLATNCLSLIHI